MSFGSNVTPKRFGAGKPDGAKTTALTVAALEYVNEAEPDPEPVPDLPIVWNEIALNDCYRCGHRGNNPVPGCACCAREHQYAPPDPED